MLFYNLLSQKRISPAEKNPRKLEQKWALQESKSLTLFLPKGE